jgi:hypothetical protein
MAFHAINAIVTEGLNRDLILPSQLSISTISTPSRFHFQPWWVILSVFL